MPEGELFTAAEYAVLADQQVGKPYVLGANGPLTFDCSGLVLWLNNRSGACRMGDTTAAGIFNLTKAVAAGAEKVGDLVFLRNNPARSNRIGHVAVLTQKLSNGDWRIIEARGRAYGVVRTTLSYWKTRRYFTGVRRLPGFKLATATPVPLPAATTAVRVATLNCLDPNIRQGKPPMLHPLTQGRKDGLARAVVNAAADFYCLTEAPEATRFVLRDAMPGGRARFKVFERGAQAIMFDSGRWAYTDSTPVELHGYHGGVIATFTERSTGQKVTIGTYHLPPNSLVTTARQRLMLLNFLAEMSHHPGVRIIGGDGIDDAAWAKPWKDARLVAAKSTTRTTPTYHGSIKDRILSDPDAPVVVWDGYSVKQTTGTDHELVVAKATISTINTL